MTQQARDRTESLIFHREERVSDSPMNQRGCQIQISSFSISLQSQDLMQFQPNRVNSMQPCDLSNHSNYSENFTNHSSAQYKTSRQVYMREAACLFVLKTLTFFFLK